MPQQHSKQAGHLPFGKTRQLGSTATSGAEASTTHEPTWQRGQGGFSGKAKKEYLKWKRQQKEAATGSDSDGSYSNTLQAGGTGRAASNRQNKSAQHTSSSQQIEQQITAPDGATDDPTQPLQYRPLVAVPAAPFTTATGTEHARVTSSSASAADGTATDSSSAALQADGADVVYMPVLDPAEVGFTTEGFQLSMPTRPAWQGAVSTAEELHALEEQQFHAWQGSLLATAAQGTCDRTSCDSSSGFASAAQQQTARAGGVGRLSFYEGRLEFWRQLWRTLEMSDIVIMIVDARNPLLHFSHALYRHITQDHKLPLLLLLNKCDLIPAAAAAAWQAWLQQQLPGVTVLPVSAAAGEAEAAAQQVLRAVQQQRVERGGQKVLVQDFVGKSVEELMAESLERNVHAKRHVIQQQQHAPAAAAGEDSSSSSTEHAADPPASDLAGYVKSAVATSGGGGCSDSNCSDSDWSLKPGRKAGARQGSKRRARRARAQQQQQQARQILGGTARRAGRRVAAAGEFRHAAAVARMLSDQGNSDATDSDDERQADTATNSESAAESLSESESKQDEQLVAMNNILEDLTLERQVSRTASLSRSSGAAESAAAAVGGGDAAASTASAYAAEAESASGAGVISTWRDDKRPVVIGLLGEPNVGKSSTLNALLGTHRVAVSCHPGRTKHYQTHFMSDKLVLCDCPGIVFPRLDVSLPMQVLFGSYPIASCRQPYAVLGYLAAASWPRLQQKLGLRHPGQLGQTGQQQQHWQSASTSLSAGSRGGIGGVNITAGQAPASSAIGGNSSTATSSTCDADDAAWSPWALCEALCEKRSWALPRSGRLDTYRAANWMLRAALGGKQGLGLAFMPPSA